MTSIIIPIKIRPHGEFSAYTRKSPGRMLTPGEILEFYKEIKAGKCEQVAKQHNLIVNKGREWLGIVLAAKNYNGSALVPLGEMKYGDGTSIPKLTDKDLAGTTIYTTDSFSAAEGSGISVDFMGYIAFSSGNDITISEAGVFFEGVNWGGILYYGGMFARCLFSQPWTKTDEQDAMIIYTLTLTAV